MELPPPCAAAARFATTDAGMVGARSRASRALGIATVSRDTRPPTFDRRGERGGVGGGGGVGMVVGEGW